MPHQGVRRRPRRSLILLLPALVAVAAGIAGGDVLRGGTVTPAVATHDCPTPPDRINVAAYVDGRSRLTIQGNSVQWQHFDFAAPGRNGFRNDPTYINCDPWYPTWPDVPNAENRNCNGCQSSVLSPAPPLPSLTTFTGMQAVGYGCRKSCWVVEAPTEGNGYKLVIEFDDDGDPLEMPGAAWYEIDVLLEPSLDHFECYEARNAVGAPRFQPRAVMLEDQFESKLSLVVAPRLFCNPVDKDEEGISNPVAHLTCYLVMDFPGQPRLRPREVLVDNQFGEQHLFAWRTSLLCVPTEKFDNDGPRVQPDGQLPLDHFKCYDSTLAAGSMFMPRQVFLTDQFASRSVYVVAPIQLCNPVDKDEEGIRNAVGHLMCYFIKDTPAQPRFLPININVANQFGETTLSVLRPYALCVPSSKEEMGHDLK